MITSRDLAIIILLRASMKHHSHTFHSMIIVFKRVCRFGLLIFIGYVVVQFFRLDIIIYIMLEWRKHNHIHINLHLAFVFLWSLYSIYNNLRDKYLMQQPIWADIEANMFCYFPSCDNKTIIFHEYWNWMHITITEEITLNKIWQNLDRNTRWWCQIFGTN